MVKHVLDCLQFIEGRQSALVSFSAAMDHT
jgi:hypothetical protein